MTPMPKPSREPPDLRRASKRLAAESGCDPLTASRWLRGVRTTAVINYALGHAAKKLKIDRDPFLQTVRAENSDALGDAVLSA